MSDSTDTTGPEDALLASVNRIKGDGGLDQVSFTSEDGRVQIHPLTGGSPAGDLERAVARAVEDARVRGGADWRRAAAALRVEGYPLVDAYNGLMATALGLDTPFGEAERAVQDAVVLAYAPPSSAVALQRAGGRPTAFTAAELVRMDLPEPKWLVEGVVPEGVTLFAGKPKLGKSRFMRAVAFALASGGVALGTVPVQQCRVLYLHLEGGLAGLKQHVIQLAAGDASAVPAALDFRTDFPRGAAGVEALAAYFEEHEDCRFMVMDTFKHFRESPDGRSSMYDDDYAATTAITKVCHRYGVHACLVHHTSKRSAEGLDDVLDLISGSTGLVAGVDNGAVLAGTSQGVVLGVRPRDLERVDLAVEWDDQVASWRLMGDAATHNASERQKQILDVIRESHDKLQAYELAQIVGLDPGVVRKELHRMRSKTPPLVDRDGKNWVLATAPLGQQETPPAEEPAF